MNIGLYDEKAAALLMRALRYDADATAFAERPRAGWRPQRERRQRYAAR